MSRTKELRIRDRSVQDGVALFEFALVAPILLLVMASIFALGLLIHEKLSLSSQAAHLARAVSFELQRTSLVCDPNNRDNKQKLRDFINRWLEVYMPKDYENIETTACVTQVTEGSNVKDFEGDGENYELETTQNIVQISLTRSSKACVFCIPGMLEPIENSHAQAVFPVNCSGEITLLGSCES